MSVPTEEQVLWGAAQMLLRRHGDRAADMVAERIRSLRAEGDVLGCAMWQAIENCLDQLGSTSEH